MAGQKMMKLKFSKLLHMNSLLNRCNLWEESFSGVDFLTLKSAKILNYIAWCYCLMGRMVLINITDIFKLTHC